VVGNKLVFVYIRTRITGMKDYIRLAFKGTVFSDMGSFALSLL